MPFFNFGQPHGGIIQVAYVVEDIQRAMGEFTARLKIGPWFVSGPFTPAKEARYRGKPTDINLMLAFGFSGHMSFELIEQHNDVAVADRSPRGYRVVYMDTTRDLPGMIELMEIKDPLEARYTEMYLASIGWDGLNPIRRAK